MFIEVSRGANLPWPTAIFFAHPISAFLPPSTPSAIESAQNNQYYLSLFKSDPFHFQNRCITSRTTTLLYKSRTTRLQLQLRPSGYLHLLISSAPNILERQEPSSLPYPIAIRLEGLDRDCHLVITSIRNHLSSAHLGLR